MVALFKTIGILGRVGNPLVRETLIALIDYLHQLGRDVVIEADTAATINDTTCPHIPWHDLSKHCHLLIVVGGDGSLLNAVHMIANDDIPILGINRGRLGFLTDIHPTKLTKIKDILDGHYILEKRFLLAASMTHHHQVMAEGCALNEVTLTPDAVPHMHEFEIYIDEQFVCSQDSDGIIVATPTGSTAYALSGGGPILHPQLDAMVIVPMFPHTLSLRPLVIEGDRQVTIIVTPNNVTTPRLSCDSQLYVSAPPGSHITISKKKRRLHLIHPLDYNYYETLRSKLHWGRKLQYSE